MKLLVIGGTRFVGLHFVTAALARHHQVTVFNRGNRALPALPNLETIQGDRTTDLVKLSGRNWDAVVDTCGYLPRTVRASAEALSNSVDRYVFISSQSVYANVGEIGVDESAPLDRLTAEQLAEANAINPLGQTSAVTYGKWYGGLKALCERSVEKVMPNRVLNVRPGLIVGPDDYTDRFTYWVLRVAQGGDVLAPGNPDRPIQFIDVRDLAEWIVRMTEQRAAGTYNANGPANFVSMEGLLSECKTISGSDARFTWVSEDFLLEHKVAAWSEMPLWLPEHAPHLKGFMFVNCDKAVAAGLSYRPLSETVKATLSWAQVNRKREELAAGLDVQRERALLRKLRGECAVPI